MIKVNSALQHDKIIKLLEEYEDEEGVNFFYIKKEGISLVFETNTEELEHASKKAKAAIKSEDWGSVLYFQVVCE